MANLRTKDGANQDRYISAGGSGTDADPTFLRHALISDTGESGIVLAASSAIRVTGVTVQDVRQATASALNATVVGAIEARQSNASAMQVTAEVRQATASALRATAEIYQATASALNATVTGAVTISAVVDVKQTTASALNATVSQAAAASGWTTRLVTPSGDTAMDTGLSAARVYLVGGSVAGVETRQSNASALKATAEIYQSAPSALRGTMEIYQATASALQVTATQVATASGWTTRIVTPSGDTAMDTSNSALRVNLVAGGAGNGNLQDGVQSNLAATVKGYASGSPLMIALTDSAGTHIASLDVKQTTASALNATVAQAANASGWTIRVVTPSGDTAMDTSNSALRVNLVAGGAGNGNIQDGVQSNLAATVKGYASGSPLLIALAQADGTHLASLDIKQATASALNATVTIPGVVDVKQTTASALQATVTQVSSPSGWTTRIVTPSGDTAMDTGLSATRVYVVGGSTAGFEARQAAASALRATAEIYQAAPSALRGTMEVYQSLASAFQVTAEVRQATASALNAQVIGELAHDAVDAGNPIKFGGKALEASPTNVATSDRVNAYFDKAGRLFTRNGLQSQDFWSATCVPGNGNVRATATRTNTASGTRLVVTGITAVMVSGSAAPAASMVSVQLTSGASLWMMTLGVPASAGLTAGVARSGLWIPSPQASGISLEFLSAGGVNVLQSVSMEGTTIVE